jgi:hypothetical protein
MRTPLSEAQECDIIGYIEFDCCNKDTCIALNLSLSIFHIKISQQPTLFYLSLFGDKIVLAVDWFFM